MGIALPLAFLEQAAPGYLSDTEWDTLWFAPASLEAAMSANRL